jgi:hypothetical protein
LQSSFPSRFNDVGSANILAEIKRESLKVIQRVKADFEGNYEEAEKLEKTIRGINDYLLSMTPSENFTNSSDNVIKKIDKSFEFVCTSMEELGVNNPKGLTVFEFYSKVEYFKSKNAKKERH